MLARARLPWRNTRLELIDVGSRRQTNNVPAVLAGFDYRYYGSQGSIAGYPQYVLLRAVPNVCSAARKRCSEPGRYRSQKETSVHAGTQCFIGRPMLQTALT